MIYITIWQKKMKFEWDITKEGTNIRKHKVSFSEACLVFSDRSLLTLFDDGHSMDEDRWITMGQIPNGQVLVVIHTYLDIEGAETIRIISARKAVKKEIEQYFKRRL